MNRPLGSLLAGGLAGGSRDIYDDEERMSGCDGSGRDICDAVACFAPSARASRMGESFPGNAGRKLAVKDNLR